jgi:hypothetical protein
MSRTEREIRGVFEKGADIEVLRHCDPNRLGIIGLCFSKKYNLFYAVQEQVFDEGYTDWDVWDFPTREAAESIYDGLVKDRSDTPNWEAQAEYDEIHGTINGEDPGIVAMRELCGE